MRWSMDPKPLITIFLCGAAEGQRKGPRTLYYQGNVGGLRICTLGTDATTLSLRAAASRWRLSVDWSRPT